MSQKFLSEYFLSEEETKASKSRHAGPFRIGRVLGKGASGTACLGTHVESGFQVALKIIRKKDLLKTPERWKILRREIAVLKLVDHPHIIKLYDVFETDDKIFLVTELARGGELFDYLQEGLLPREIALRLLAQITMGLLHCHNHGIVHRDIKPENLLLDEEKNVKIADFGMAQLVKPGSILKTSCGSPHYTSPEVIEGRYDGKSSDVWSLGVILFAMVTGCLPFHHDNVTSLLRLVQAGIFEIPEQVEPDIADLIQRMIKVNVKERIKMEDIQQHAVFAKTKYFQKMESFSLESLAWSDRRIATIDENIFQDLKALLGGGGEDEIRGKLAETEVNLEKSLYFLLEGRKHNRIQELRKLSPLSSAASSRNTSPTYTFQVPIGMPPSLKLPSSGEDEGKVMFSMEDRAYRRTSVDRSSPMASSPRGFLVDPEGSRRPSLSEGESKTPLFSVQCSTPSSRSSSTTYEDTKGGSSTPGGSNPTSGPSSTNSSRRPSDDRGSFVMSLPNSAAGSRRPSMDEPGRSPVVSQPTSRRGSRDVAPFSSATSTLSALAEDLVSSEYRRQKVEEGPIPSLPTRTTPFEPRPRWSRESFLDQLRSMTKALRKQRTATSSPTSSDEPSFPSSPTRGSVSSSPSRTPAPSSPMRTPAPSSPMRTPAPSSPSRTPTASSRSLGSPAGSPKASSTPPPRRWFAAFFKRRPSMDPSYTTNLPAHPLPTLPPFPEKEALERASALQQTFLEKETPPTSAPPSPILTSRTSSIIPVTDFQTGEASSSALTTSSSSAILSPSSSSSSISSVSLPLSLSGSNSGCSRSESLSGSGTGFGKVRVPSSGAFPTTTTTSAGLTPSSSSTATTSIVSSPGVVISAAPSPPPPPDFTL